MNNFKLIGILFGVALATTILATTIEKMSERVEKKELLKAVAEDVVKKVVE